MKCMLLTAGFGNRLRPLTVLTAKPSLPLGGRPLVLHTLDRLAEAGIDEVFLNLHHLPETLRRVVESGAPTGLEITFADEPEILGTAGGLKAVQSLFGDEASFLLVNGDCYYGFSFGPILEAHRSNHPLATMAVRQCQPGSNYGVLDLDENGRMSRIAGRPRPSPRTPVWERMFVGVHVISDRIWKYMEREGFYDINADVYPKAIAAGEEILGFEVRGPWHDIGTPRRYLAANLDLLHSSESLVDPGRWPGVRIESPVLAADDVEVSEGVILQGGVILGSGSTVGASSIVSRSVILDGVRIGARCTIEDSVVGPGVAIPDNSDYRESVIVPFQGHEKQLRRRELVGENIVARFDSYER